MENKGSIIIERNDSVHRSNITSIGASFRYVHNLSGIRDQQCVFFLK